MARRGSVQRDVNNIATDQVLYDDSFYDLEPNALALSVEDRRNYYFDQFRFAGSVFRDAARLVPARANAFSFWPPAEVRFKHPNWVAICVRRKIRRQVLMALHGGRGGRSWKKPRRNYYSHVRC